MSLEPFFSLSPLNPYINNYDASNSNMPYAMAIIQSYGGITDHGSVRRLETQYNNDEILMGWNAVSLDNQTLHWSAENHPFRQCSIYLGFSGNNVSKENQYLLIFGLQGLQYSPIAQFFIGNDLVDTEELSGDEQHSILLDCPGDGRWIQIIVRLASNNFYAAMGFKGVDCYLL